MNVLNSPISMGQVVPNVNGPVLLVLLLRFVSLVVLIARIQHTSIMEIVFLLVGKAILLRTEHFLAGLVAIPAKIAFLILFVHLA